MDYITLKSVGGMGQLSGWDQHGRYWVQCWTEYGNESLGIIRCAFCGKLITEDSEVWVCSESGELGCEDHVDY